MGYLPSFMALAGWLAEVTDNAGSSSIEAEGQIAVCWSAICLKLPHDMLLITLLWPLVKIEMTCKVHYINNCL